MISNLKISVYLGSFSLIIFLISSLSANGQLRRISTTDSLRMDSAMRVMKQWYSKKVDSVANDTANRTFKQSRFHSIFIAPNTIAVAGQNLLVQAVRSAQSYYLNVLVKMTLTAPVTASANDLLHITFDDNSTITFSTIGNSASHSNGMRNGTDLAVEYALQQPDFLSLSSKKVKTITLDYDGGSYVFAINGEGSLNIQKAFMSIR